MSQRESKLSRDIMGALRAEGWFCFKVHGSDKMMSGLPDIIVCAEGKFIGLETKMPEKVNNTSVIQEHRHSQIREAGGVAEVVTSPAQAVRIVRLALAA